MANISRYDPLGDVFDDIMRGFFVRPMAYVTLTIDHRVVDGHQTNAWLSRFVDILENWPAG